MNLLRSASHPLNHIRMFQGLETLSTIGIVVMERYCDRSHILEVFVHSSKLKFCISVIFSNSGDIKAHLI